MSEPTSEDRGVPRSRDELSVLVRRLIRRMVWLGIAASSVFVLKADFQALGILTLTVVVSIFLVLSLQAHVVSLDVRQAPPRVRTLLLALVRHFVLAAGLILVLLLDVSRPVALILGVSTLPLALLAETLASLRGDRHARPASQPPTTTSTNPR